MSLIIFFSFCKIGYECTEKSSWLCPRDKPEINCQCSQGCRVGQMFIPLGESYYLDECGSFCSCFNLYGKVGFLAILYTFLVFVLKYFNFILTSGILYKNICYAVSKLKLFFFKLILNNDFFSRPNVRNSNA